MADLFIYVDSTSFDSIKALDISLLRVQFSKDSKGLYVQNGDSFIPFITNDNSLIRYSPGVLTLLPKKQ